MVVRSPTVSITVEEAPPPEEPRPWWEEIVKILKWVTITTIAIGGVYIAAQLIRPREEV